MANQLNKVAMSRMPRVAVANSPGPPIRLASTAGATVRAPLATPAYVPAPVYRDATSGMVIPREALRNAMGTPANVGHTPGAVARGRAMPIPTTGALLVSARFQAAMWLQAELSQMAWDLLLSDQAPTSLALRGGAVYSPTQGFGVRAGTTNTYVGPPPVPAPPLNPIKVAVASYLDLFPSTIANQWVRAFGVTAPYLQIGVPSPAVKTCWFELVLPPIPSKAPMPLFYPVVDPLKNPEIAPQSRPRTRTVTNPNVHLRPTTSVGLSVSPGRAAVNQRPDFNDPLEPANDAKWRNKALMGIMRALEEAGDAGELLAVWYQAAREKAFEEGIYMPSWGQSSWSTRISGIQRGLTLGVDYVSLAEGVGEWWVGERLGAILFPTSRTPGSGVSNNVKLHRPQNAMRDMFL